MPDLNTDKLGGVQVTAAGESVIFDKMQSSVEFRCTDYSVPGARMAVAINAAPPTATIGDDRVLLQQGEILVFRGAISSLGLRMTAGTGVAQVNGSPDPSCNGDEINADYT